MNEHFPPVERRQRSILPPGSTDASVIALWLRKFKRSPNTQEAYTRDVQRFQNFVQKPLAHVTLQDLYDYEDSLDELGVSTRSRLMASLKSLFTFAYKTGYLLVNVGAAYHLEEPPDTLATRILSEEQVMNMVLGEPNPRNQLILRILYSAGLRVSELCDLNWAHVQPNDAANAGGGQITVLQGKRRKTRNIVLKPETYTSLIAIRRNAPGDAPVFASHNSNRLDRVNVWRIVEQAAIRADVEVYMQPDESGRPIKRTSVSPHWLRHAHASHFIARGGDLAVLRDTLGHKDFAMPSRYAHARPYQSSSLKLIL